MKCPGFSSILAQAIAKRRIRRAQELIEEAQHRLERAAQELSPLCGGAAACSQVARAGERAHRLWYQVGRLADRVGSSVGLDHDPRTSAFDAKDFPEEFRHDGRAA